MIQPEKDVRPSLYTETTTTARGTPHQCCQAKSLLKNMSKIRRPNTKQLRQRSLYATIESAGIAWLQHLCTLGTRKLWTHTNALALRLPLRKGAAEILCFKNPRKPTVAPFCDMPMVQPVEPRQSIQYSALVPLELHHRATLLLLMPILTQAFLTLVGRHLMTLTLLTAWHRRSSLVIN